VTQSQSQTNITDIATWTSVTSQCTHYGSVAYVAQLAGCPTYNSAQAGNSNSNAAPVDVLYVGCSNYNPSATGQAITNPFASNRYGFGTSTNYATMTSAVCYAPRFTYESFGMVNTINMYAACTNISSHIAIFAMHDTTGTELTFLNTNFATTEYYGQCPTGYFPVMSIPVNFLSAFICTDGHLYGYNNGGAAPATPVFVNSVAYNYTTFTWDPYNTYIGTAGQYIGDVYIALRTSGLLDVFLGHNSPDFIPIQTGLNPCASFGPNSVVSSIVAATYRRFFVLCYNSVTAVNQIGVFNITQTASFISPVTSTFNQGCINVTNATTLPVTGCNAIVPATMAHDRFADLLAFICTSPSGVFVYNTTSGVTAQIANSTTCSTAFQNVSISASRVAFACAGATQDTLLITDLTLSPQIVAPPVVFSSSQTPFSSSQTPFSSSQTPFSSSQTPFSSSQTPFSSSQTPFSSSLTPFSSSKTPFSSSLTPFSSSQTPFSSSQTPFSSSLTPVSSSQTPASSSQTPYSSSLTPASSSLTPFSSSLTPASSSLTPVSSSQTPYSSSANPPTTPAPTTATKRLPAWTQSTLSGQPYCSKYNSVVYIAQYAGAPPDDQSDIGGNSGHYVPAAVDTLFVSCNGTATSGPTTSAFAVSCPFSSPALGGSAGSPGTATCSSPSVVGTLVASVTPNPYFTYESFGQIGSVIAMYASSRLTTDNTSVSAFTYTNPSSNTYLGFNGVTSGTAIISGYCPAGTFVKRTVPVNAAAIYICTSGLMFDYNRPQGTAVAVNGTTYTYSDFTWDPYNTYAYTSGSATGGDIQFALRTTGVIDLFYGAVNPTLTLLQAGVNPCSSLGANTTVSMMVAATYQRLFVQCFNSYTGVTVLGVVTLTQSSAFIVAVPGGGAPTNPANAGFITVGNVVPITNTNCTSFGNNHMAHDRFADLLAFTCTSPSAGIFVYNSTSNGVTQIADSSVCATTFSSLSISAQRVSFICSGATQDQIFLADLSLSSTYVTTAVPTTVTPTTANATTAAPTTVAPTTVPPTTVNPTAACGTPLTQSVTNTGQTAYVFNVSGSNPSLLLVVGQTYTFLMNASGHPLWIKAVAGNGVGNSSYLTPNLVNNGVDVGTITWTITPNLLGLTLTYDCQYHVAMEGTIQFVAASVCPTPNATTAAPTTITPTTAPATTATPTTLPPTTPIATTIVPQTGINASLVVQTSLNQASLLLSGDPTTVATVAQSLATSMGISVNLIGQLTFTSYTSNQLSSTRMRTASYSRTQARFKAASVTTTSVLVTFVVYPVVVNGVVITSASVLIQNITTQALSNTTVLYTVLAAAGFNVNTNVPVTIINIVPAFTPTVNITSSSSSIFVTNAWYAYLTYALAACVFVAAVLLLLWWCMMKHPSRIRERMRTDDPTYTPQRQAHRQTPPTTYTRRPKEAVGNYSKLGLN